MNCPDWVRKDMKKSGQAKVQTGVKDMGSLFHGQKVMGYADGGEALKQEGLKASNAEYDSKSQKDKAVSSFKRLFEGSIDDPNSTAYKKYGAGRGQRERDFDAAEKQLDQLDALRKQESEKPVVNKVAPRTPKQDMVNDQDTSSRPSETKPQKFGAAFAAARKAGKQSFEWNGKRYTTEVAKAKKATAEGRDMDSSRQTSKAKAAPPRPRLNFSTPGDRTRWDAKYKATHNADGTPK